MRLDWKGEEPPSNMHDGRATAAAPLALELHWATMCSYRFFRGDHINIVELESLISLLRRVTREGAHALELLRHLCTAAHSRPCTATSMQVRLACLHHVFGRCTVLFSGPSRPQPTSSEEFTPFYAAALSNRVVFANTVLPLGALLLPLTDVAKKT